MPNRAERYVQLLFSAELGRAGSGVEVSALAPLLFAPDGLPSVARLIAQSPEALVHRVRGWYQAYLGRPAQNGEELGRAVLLFQGVPETRALALLLSSPEFIARSQELFPTGGADERYAGALFQLLLNRDADPAAVRLATRGGATNGSGFATLLSSPEYRLAQLEGYVNTLFRQPGDPVVAGLLAFSALDLATARVLLELSPSFVFGG